MLNAIKHVVKKRLTPFTEHSHTLKEVPVICHTCEMGVKLAYGLYKLNFLHYCDIHDPP